MSPLGRLVARSVLAGVLVTVNALIVAVTGSDLTGNEILLAVLQGVASGITWSGLEAGTPINRTVGVGKQ